MKRTRKELGYFGGGALRDSGVLVTPKNAYHTLNRSRANECFDYYQHFRRGPVNMAVNQSTEA